tara:strand:+ start:320 stop:1087 length:768 start_codon:yes stop_codon:yes gene_type:complete
MRFTVYPAIDIVNGKCVRLYQGDYGKEKIYGDDPLDQALQFAQEGAQWIHVVDLDAARTGDLKNYKIIGDIASTLNIPIQVGGGIRNSETARSLFDLGVTRVVLGTAAVEQPKLVEELANRGNRVAVGIDGKEGFVATRGWKIATEIKVTELARQFESSGAETAIVTEIQRDGTLQGPDLKGLSEILTATSLQIIASGGLGSIEDLRDLVNLHKEGKSLAGVITGKALYEKKLNLKEVIEYAEAQVSERLKNAEY